MVYYNTNIDFVFSVKTNLTKCCVFKVPKYIYRLNASHFVKKNAVFVVLLNFIFCRIFYLHTLSHSHVYIIWSWKCLSGIRQETFPVAFTAYVDHKIEHLGIDQPIKYDKVLVNVGSAYNVNTGNNCKMPGKIHVFKEMLITIRSFKIM